MTLDPNIVAIRAGLAPFRRRLWLRRIVRDATWVVAALVGLELLLALAARLAPLGWAWSVALAVPVVGVVAMLIDAVRVRPTLAETALALDGEQGLRDRISSALEIADRSPELSGVWGSDEAVGEAGTATADDGRTTESATYADFVRLQRRDALSQPARRRPPSVPSPSASSTGAHRGRSWPSCSSRPWCCPIPRPTRSRNGNASARPPSARPSGSSGPPIG